MRSSPLLLKEYFTTRLSFSATPGFVYDPSGSREINYKDLNVEILEGQQEENPLQRTCQLLVELKEPASNKFPYMFSIMLVGFFEIIPEWPSDQVNKLFSANAPALLYSAAREAVATATGRGPYPGILLPSVTFVQLPAEKPVLEEKQLPFPDVEQVSVKEDSPSETNSGNKTTRKTTRKSSKNREEKPS